MELAIEEGLIRDPDFSQFCNERGLEPMSRRELNLDSVRVYAAATLGQTIVMLKLPVDPVDADEALQLCVDFAKEHQLKVLDPQSGEIIGG